MTFVTSVNIFYFLVSLLKIENDSNVLDVVEFQAQTLGHEAAVTLRSV